MFQDFNEKKKEMCYPLKPIVHIIVLIVFIQLNLGGVQIWGLHP